MKPSIAIEDYLKVIYKLQQSMEVVTTSDIANEMGVSMASTSNMVKRLAENGFLNHEPYKGVQLTPEGEKFILKLVRRHRLLELFLTQVLKMDWDKVDDEAERLEHVISNELEQKIDELLGFPTVDPHGDPIPRVDGTIDKPNLENLANLSPGNRAIISRVSDSNPEILRYLNNLGMVPNTDIEIIRKEPFNGPILVRVNENEHHIGQEVADTVFVERVTKKENI